jgi:hypothetical protein
MAEHAGVSVRLLFWSLRWELHSERDPVLGKRRSDLQRIWEVDDDNRVPVRLLRVGHLLGFRFSGSDSKLPASG